MMLEFVGRALRVLCPGCWLWRGAPTGGGGNGVSEASLGRAAVERSGMTTQTPTSKASNVVASGRAIRLQSPVLRAEEIRYHTKPATWNSRTAARQQPGRMPTRRASAATKETMRA